MGSHADEVYAFGPYRLDAGRRTLTRQDRPVALAPKTFDLLLLMVQRPAHAFSKQELMAALWPDTFVEEANLSFQVSTLRKTLGDGSARCRNRGPARLPVRCRRERPGTSGNGSRTGRPARRYGVPCRRRANQQRVAARRPGRRGLTATACVVGLPDAAQEPRAGQARSD